MTKRKWLWLSFRIAWIIVGLIQGPRLVAEIGGDRPQQPSWIFAIQMIGIISIAVVVLIGIQACKFGTADVPPPSVAG